MEIAEVIYKALISLLSTIMKDIIKNNAKDFITRKRVENRIDNAISEVMVSLNDFLNNEKVTEIQKILLINTCEVELHKEIYNTNILFGGSLDGQTIIDTIYSKRSLPKVITEENLSDVFTMLCVRIATVLCELITALKDWESRAWIENYKRLDEISLYIRQLYSKIDQINFIGTKRNDELLSRVKRVLAQRKIYEYDFTALRAEKQINGDIDECFIHPTISRKFEKLATKSICFSRFSKKYNNKHILIAPAGSGKTTWSKWFQLESFITFNNNICFRLELRKIDLSSKLSIYDLIRDNIGRQLAEELTSEVISSWFNQGIIILLFDGFDEIRPENRNAAAKFLEDLSFTFEYSTIIITSRPLTTNHLIDMGEKKNKSDLKWLLWEIEQFDEPRIKDFIIRWYKYNPSIPSDKRNIDLKKLLADLENDPTIKPLLGNPLLLSTLLMVNFLGGGMPSGRSELYNRYVEGMIGEWDDRRQINSLRLNVSIEKKRQVIRRFALQLFFSGKDQEDENIIEKWFDKYALDIQCKIAGIELLKYFRERTSLIVGPGLYSFVHKSIEEYLVADAIFQGDQSDPRGTRIDRLSLLEHHNDDIWNTVIFLWAGLAPISDVESYIVEVLRKGNISLGCGIIFDQFERISNQIRIKIFERLCECSFNLYCQHDNDYLVYFPAKEDSINIEIFDFILRGLIPNSYFTRLIGKYINEGNIGITEAKLIKNPFIQKTILYLLAAVEKEKNTLIEIIKELQNCTKEIKIIYYILYFLRENLSLKNSKLSLKDELIEIFPDGASIFFFSSLSLLKKYIEDNTMNQTNEVSEFHDTIKLLIEKIIIHDIITIDSSWLISTLRWNCNDDIIDILYDINEYFKNKGDNKKYASIRLYITKVISKRSVLVENQRNEIDKKLKEKKEEEEKEREKEREHKKNDDKAIN